MFEKLRRAKSFIHRSKCEEERPKRSDLDLSETSHLRRNVSIGNEVLKQQHNLNNIQERDGKRKTLRRQVSKSNEHLHDGVVEQLRRLNFGDSYSKKQAQKLRESSDEPQEFERRHPAYISERNYRRKSVGTEEKTKNAQKSGRSEKYVHHRNSGDVMSNFDRRNPAYCSETRVGVQKSAINTQKTSKNVNNCPRKTDEEVLNNCNLTNPAYRSENRFNATARMRSPTRSAAAKCAVEDSTKNIHDTDEEDIPGNFDRRNPAYWSERSVQILRQKCSEQSDFTTTRVVGGDGDFLLNRKSVDLSYNFDRRNPAYVSERSAQKIKPDLLDITGLKSLFQKVKVTAKHHYKDSSETSSVSSGSASSSGANTLIGRDRRAHVSEECLTGNLKTVSANESGFSSGSTGSSIDRHHPAYVSGKEAQKPATVLANEEQSRKRRHNLTKSNFDRNKPVYSSERTSMGESRKKVVDVMTRDGDGVIGSDKR